MRLRMSSAKMASMFPGGGGGGGGWINFSTPTDAYIRPNNKPLVIKITTDNFSKSLSKPMLAYC